MISCSYCERSHRDQEGIEKCKLRAERREAREAARKADTERRAKNLKKLSVEDFIAEKMREGSRYDYQKRTYAPFNWDRIVAALNKNYPIREEGKYTLWDVIAIDSINLLKTWPAELETIVALRAEKYMTGEFITKHPLSLPVDGSYSLEVA